MTITSDFIKKQSISSCSKPYLKAQLLTFILYLGYFMAYTLPFITHRQPDFLLLFTAKYALEAASFVLLSHLLLRPAIKPILPKTSQLRHWLLLSALIVLAAIIQAMLTYQLSHIDIFRDTDLSQLTILTEEHTSPLQITFSARFILLTYGATFFVMYAVWCFAYIVWHNIQARKALQNQVQQARLQQLTNQLSPHFLFNAFNSIRALIFEDQQKAADTVTRLSELFRFHLQAHLHPTLSLQEEWQLTSQYLAIEQIRLEQRLQISTDFAPELWHKTLPTLSLLSLVENAVKHGIAPISQGGALTVSTHKLANGWRLIVSNSRKAGAHSSGAGTGLNNLRQRLQMMYSNNAQLMIEKTDNSFTVTMEFSDV